MFSLYVFPFLLTIFGLIVGYFVGQRRSSPLPFYKSSDFPLFTGLEIYEEIQELSFSYKGIKIESLTLTILGFWNEGKEALEQNQISRNNLVQLYLDEELDSSHVIIRAKIEWQSDENNNCFELTKTSNNENVYDLNFQFVEHGQGVIIYVIHTSPLRKSIKIKGGIKGFGEIRPKNIDDPSWELKGYHMNSISLVFAFLALIGTVVFVSTVMILMLDAQYEIFGGIINSPNPPIWFLSLFYLGFISVTSLFLFSFLRQVSARFRAIPTEIKERLNRSR